MTCTMVADHSWTVYWCTCVKQSVTMGQRSFFRSPNTVLGLRMLGVNMHWNKMVESCERMVIQAQLIQHEVESVALTEACAYSGRNNSCPQAGIPHAMLASCTSSQITLHAFCTFSVPYVILKT